MLAPFGWSTFALGKWHLTPLEDVNLAANRKWWPLGRGAPGTARLFVGDELAGEAEIPVTVPLAFALSGEGLCCGWDSLSPASSTYPVGFRFTGTLRRVVVEVDG